MNALEMLTKGPLDHSAIRRSWIEEGRQLIVAGTFYPTHQGLQRSIMLYRAEQRRRVWRTGRCECQCKDTLIRNPIGELVCPHTFERCPSQALNKIVSLLGKVNS